MAICFRGVWTLPQSWLVYSWSYFPHQELVQTWDGTWFWSMRHERVCWGGRSVSGKAFAWVAETDLPHAVRVLIWDVRTETWNWKSHIGPWGKPAEACSDKPTRRGWTRTRPRQCLWLWATEPANPRITLDLFLFEGRHYCFSSLRQDFLLTSQNTHSARNQSGTMALYCQVFFSNSLMRPSLPRHISLPNSYSKPLADHSPVTPLGSSPASSPISLLFLRHSSFLCQTSEGSQF